MLRGRHNLDCKDVNLLGGWQVYQHLADSCCAPGQPNTPGMEEAPEKLPTPSRPSR